MIRMMMLILPFDQSYIFGIVWFSNVRIVHGDFQCICKSEDGLVP